jgi:hypothetical protein
MAEVVLEDADKNDEDNPDDDASSSLDDVEASPPPVAARTLSTNKTTFSLGDSLYSSLPDDDDFVPESTTPTVRPALLESPMVDGGIPDISPMTPTDNEVGKYSFLQRLEHYMEGNKVSESNHMSVELCLLVEAGTAVRNMNPMKKDKRAEVFFAWCMAIVDEIEDVHFKEDEAILLQVFTVLSGPQGL